MTCSALKRRFRDHIRALAPATVFIELRSDRAQLAQRMAAREHFMPPILLDSQLSTLEPLEPDEPGVGVANDAPADEVTSRVLAALTEATGPRRLGRQPGHGP